jgi:hypothetical protein
LKQKTEKGTKAMAKSRSGGGIAGKNVTQKPVKYGERARKINERGVAQIGTNRGNHATEKAGLLKGDVERVRGELKPSGGPGGVMLGNETAKLCGPRGEGRTLYGQAGSQKMYGSANPGNAPAKNTDILRQFGPDVPGRR